MVRSVLQVVYREVRGLHQAAYVLAVFTFGSQLLALIRDRLLAHQFGAGTDLDLYYAAFRIPDLLYVLFASTLSVYVLIPFVAERIQGTDSTRARALLSQIFSLFLIGYSALAFVIGLCAPFIVQFLFPGFAAEGETLVLMIRILLLQPFLLGISSLLGVITQFNHRFVLYAVSPLLYNLGIIFGLIVLYPHYGLMGLGLGVVIGALGHLVVQLPFIIESELAPRFIFKLSWKDLRDVFITSLPRALTLSLHQLVLLCLIGFASIMTVGSVSVFQFAFNLQSVPLAIIGMSYSVAAFPLLAQMFAEKRHDEFSNHIMTALRHIIFWSLPVVALMIVVRAQFVRVILGTGEFDWNDTRLTAAVLAIFALSLTAQAIHMLIVRALYARGDTRLPFVTTLFSSLLALVFSFAGFILFQSFPQVQNIIESLMRLEGVPGTEILALPLGYSLAIIINSAALIVYSRKELLVNVRVLTLNLFRAFTAAVVAGIVAYGTLNFIVVGIQTDTLLGIFLQGFFASVAGFIAALSTYFALRSPELSEVYRSLHRRIFKTEVIGPQDEDHLAV